MYLNERNRAFKHKKRGYARELCIRTHNNTTTKTKLINVNIVFRVRLMKVK